MSDPLSLTAAALSEDMNPWCALAAFLQLQPGQAHLPGIPLRTTARSLRRFASIQKGSLCLRWSQCGTACRNLGYFWGYCPIFQTPKPMQFPVFRGRGALSTKCLLAGPHGKQRSPFRAVPAIQNLYCLTVFCSTKLSSPPETSPPPIPQKGESTSGKPSVENYCQGSFETEELSVPWSVQNPTSQLSSHAVNPLVPSTSLMLPVLLQLASQVSTQTWVFPQACIW